MPYLVLDNQGQKLPPVVLNKQRHLLGRDSSQADLVVPEYWRVVSGKQALLLQVDGNYYIYDGDGQQPSTNGIFINHARVSTTEGVCLQDGYELQIGQNPNNLIRITYFDPHNPAPRLAQQPSLSLANRSVVLGRSADANLQLNSVTVSRHHATIDSDQQGRFVLHNHSPNGVWIDGYWVERSSVLAPGTIIRVGPYTLALRDDKLVLLDAGDRIRLDAANVVRQVQGQTLLNRISLSIEPGQFLGLVGGSGAGKSTLMRTLLGIEPVTEGKIALNGEDLRSKFDVYRTQIGYVPQDDIVHSYLTVSEVLHYAAKLRLPPDADVRERVRSKLEQIELPESESKLVSQLSGGQRKRVSIGVELLADPKLFFLDEPTSGLDPGLEKKMMQLLRKLADQGRTVVLVTHATANITLCDRIAFMGQGGNLCYFGPPQEALDFFAVKSGDFAEIYNQLEDTESAAAEASRFGQSQVYTKYISSNLSLEEQDPTATPSTSPPTRSPLQQLTLLAHRYLKILRRDTVNLVIALLTAPLGMSLISIAVTSEALVPADTEMGRAGIALRVLFVLTSAAIWTGLSSSLQELVKESSIYQRERLVNLSIWAYLGSKEVVLGGLAFLQTLLVACVVLFSFDSPDPNLLPWSLGMGITTYLTLLAAVNLGLAVSAVVKNGAQASGTLPMVLIPQIIFSGVLFELEDGAGSFVSWVMLSRWSIGAYGALADVNNLVPESVQNGTGQAQTASFEPTPVYESSWENLALNWGIMGIHAAVAWIVAFWSQKRKDIL